MAMLTAQGAQSGRTRRLAAVVGAWTLGAALLSGCATTPANKDPFENFNRKMFAFNEAMDTSVLKPAATTYQKVVPSVVRRGVSNFFGNIYDVWSAVNLVLQGRFADGLNDFMRFTNNSFFGVLGVFDVATDMGLEKHGEDFGQTLGKWGLPPGPYIYFPILGPSSVRDAMGLPVELKVSAENWMAQGNMRLSMSGLRIVNARSNFLGATGMLDDIALDKYTFIRDAYLQRRRNLVYDGSPPDDEANSEEDRSDDGAADAPAKP